MTVRRRFSFASFAPLRVLRVEKLDGPAHRTVTADRDAGFGGQPTSLTAAQSRTVRVLRTILAAALLAATACASDEPTAGASSGLVGRWTSERFPSLPQGTYDYRLTFGGDGRFEWTWSSYGIYEGQSASQLSAYTVTTGSYRAEGGELTLLTEQTRTWDRFYGADSKEDVRRFSPPAGTLYDRAQYRVEGGVLTLDYLSYPLDAPVPTQATFRRAR
jgi:hypothetical protein